LAKLRTVANHGMQVKNDRGSAVLFHVHGSSRSDKMRPGRNVLCRHKWVGETSVGGIIVRGIMSRGTYSAVPDLPVGKHASQKSTQVFTARCYTVIQIHTPQFTSLMFSVSCKRRITK